MAQVLVSVKNLTNIANAIRNKLEVSTSYKPAQMASAINSIPHTNITNGVLGKYKALQEPVDAFTFVEVINKVTVQDDNVLAITSGAKLAALSSSKVFMIYSNDNMLYGAICTISNNQISVGDGVQLSSVSGSATDMNITALSSSAVFITHNSGSSALNSMVCTVSGTTITPGTDTQIAAYSGYNSVTALSSDKVFVSYAYGRDSGEFYLRCKICTISGTTITAGTETSLSSMSYSAYDSKSVTLDSDKVFIMHSSGGRFGGAINGIVCSVSGTAITLGVDTALCNYAEISSGAGCDALSGTKVMIAHNFRSSAVLGATACTISGTTITIGNDIALTDVLWTNSSLSVIALSDSMALITHPGGLPSYYLSAIPCTLSGTKIIPGADTVLWTGTSSYGNPSPVKLNSTQALIAHNYGSGGTATNGILCSPETVVKKSTTKIGGITRETCSTEYAGDVWILDK